MLVRRHREPGGDNNRLTINPFPVWEKSIRVTDMQGVARNFFTLAIIYALCGMALGLHMAISQDHGQMPTHAHTMVAGWLMSSVFAFFYHLFPAAGQK